MSNEIITTTQNQLSQIRSQRITDILSNSEKTFLQVKSKGKLLRKHSLSELNTFLSALAQLVGLTPVNMPNINAMKLLMDSVIHLYGHLTNEEVKNAFNLLIAGEIKLDKEDAHYQSFSAHYFSTVVRKYLNYASKILRELPDEVKQEIMELPMSDEDFINDRYRDWYYMKNKKYEFIDVTLYEMLRKKQLIKLNDDEKVKIKNQILLRESRPKQIKEFKDVQSLHQ